MYILEKNGPTNMKVAIAHYWFVSWRGGEKVVESMLKLNPDADIYTLFCDPKIKEKYFPNNKVFSSWFDCQFFRKFYQLLFPLYPLFIWTVRLRQQYDLLITSESGPIKGMNASRAKKHLCYIHTPMRYAWGYTQEYLRVLPKLLRPIANLGFYWLRFWDARHINSVGLYVANSKNVQDRVLRYYGKKSEIVYPPIAESFFTDKKIAVASNKSHFLCFGALVPYKRIDLAVECFID